MNVLILAGGADTGGQGIATKQAFDRHSSMQVRSVSVSKNYLAYAADLWWPADKRLIRRLFAEADVLHVRNTFLSLKLVGALDFDRKRPPMLIQHHGTDYREHPSRLLHEAARYGAATYVSTIDLLTAAPVDHVGWIPAPLDIDALAAFRVARPAEAPLRVGHAPTVRASKGTDVFLEAFAQVEKTRNIELVMIEGKPQVECLAIKGTCDILFDQLTFGYGSNALEAFAMGIPVLSGAEDPAVLDRMRSVIGFLPFLPCTRANLAEQLRRLIDQEQLREDLAAVGRSYVQTYHAAPVVVKRLERIYRTITNRAA